MFRIIFLVVAFSLTPLAVFSQTVADPDAADAADKQEKQNVELLRETLADVDGMRLVENRISFRSELASLMWFHNEADARAMYAGVVADFRQLVAQLDAQMNVMPPKIGEDVDNTGSMFTEPTDRQKVAKKFAVAITVRQAIVMSIADHDADLALSFFYDSLSGLTNAELRRQMAMGDRSLEQQLFEKVAANDPSKAAELLKKSAEKGLRGDQVDLLKKIFAKDPEQGADLAQTLLGSLKSSKSDTLDLSAVSSLLSYGTQSFDQSRSASGTKPVFTDSELRDIAEAYAQAVLARPPDANLPYANYARDIERFQPGRAAQIRSRIQGRPGPQRPGGFGPPQQIRGQGSGSGVGYVTASNSAANIAQQQRDAAEKKMMDDVMKIGSGKLPDDQRDKIIQQARKTIMSMPGKDKKVADLSALAAQVNKAGDQELANDIMRDAASFVNTQPKNYQDYLLSWMLASGYAAVDPEKAFPILDDTIGRANEVIVSSIKVAEFIDTGEDIIADGELQVGSFGGSMVRSLTNELGAADPTLQILAKADFQRMHDLTNRFDRTEIRVLAKMMLLRALLAPKQKAILMGTGNSTTKQ